LIRNNFYRLKLHDVDKYYKLIELKNLPILTDDKNFSDNREIINLIFELFFDFKNKIFIAGGSLISGIISGSDVDIFLCSTEEEGNQIIKKLFEINKASFSLDLVKISGINFLIIIKCRTCLYI
jgi:hypothetical protein